MRTRFPVLAFAGLVAAAALGVAGMAPATVSSSTSALSDEELLHVFITANQGELMSSQPLLDDLGNPDAQQFAQEMITDHARVLEQAQALDLEPQDNPVSASMAQMVTGKTHDLDQMESPELDVKYMETQVVLHGHTLDMIDYVLLPNIHDDAFRALVEQARPAVMQHFQRAQQIHHRMMAGMNDDAGMNGDTEARSD